MRLGVERLGHRHRSRAVRPSFVCDRQGKFPDECACRHKGLTTHAKPRDQRHLQWHARSGELLWAPGSCQLHVGATCMIPVLEISQVDSMSCLAGAGASNDRGLTDAALRQLGQVRSSLLHTVAAMSGRQLLVDYKGSDPVGADTLGNGKSKSVVNLFVNPKLAAVRIKPLTTYPQTSKNSNMLSFHCRPFTAAPLHCTLNGAALPLSRALHDTSPQ